MPARRGEWIAAACFLLAGVLFLRPGFIVPDALATWSWLRSLVLDGDLLFLNEWASVGAVHDGFADFKEVTSLDTLANHWWIGSAYVGALPYLIAHAIASSVAGIGKGGFAGAYGWTLAWLSVASLWYVRRVTREIEPRLDARLHEILFVCLVLGTPLFWYTFRFSTLSHLPGAAAVGLLTFALHRTVSDPDGRTDLLLGLSVGLSAAIRLQHAMLIGSVIVVLVACRRPLTSWVRVAAGVLPFASLQGVAWYAVYGSPLGPLTSGVDPTGGTWSAFTQAAFGEALFASWNGLFFWAPITLLSVAGWLIAVRDTRMRILALAFVMMFAGELIANGAMDRWWWGGFSFGPRRWIDLAVPFLIGLVWLASRARAIVVSAAVACAAWGTLLMLPASTRSLDLGGPIFTADILHAIRRVELSQAFRELLIPSWGALTHAAGALIGGTIVTACLLLVFMLARRRLLTASAVLFAIIGIAWIGLAIPPTRERAGFFIDHFGIDAQRRSMGALIDRRGLLEGELAWKRRRGEPLERTVADLQAVDASIAAALNQ